VLDVIENCRKGLANIPAAVVGWRLSQLKCDGGAMSLTWTREHGFSAPPQDWSIGESGMTATSSVPLPKAAVRGHEDLLNPAEVTRRYLAQNWMGTLVRLQDDPPPPPPPNYKGPWNPPPAPWVKRSFTLTVPNLPSELPLYFRDLPGALVNAMIFKPGTNSAGGSWSVEGVIYENRV
jgi:hypothetical protein